MLEGEARLSPDWGFNYVASVGNGVPGFEVMGNVRATQFDSDNNRTVTGRVALVRASKDKNGIRAELGFSVANGSLRNSATSSFILSLAADDPNRFAAEFTAYGTDLRISAGTFGLRSYFYKSQEQFTGAPVDQFNREGMTIEPSLTIDVPSSVSVKSISIIGRYSFASEEQFTPSLDLESLRRLQYGAAVNVRFENNLTLKAAYVTQKESRDLPYADNNALTLTVTGEF